MNVWNLPNHYNPKYYEDPHSFIPERWENGELEKKIHPMALLNFSSGPRACIGRQLAELELRIIPIILFRRYKLRLEKEDFGFTLGFTYHPEVFKTELIKRA